MDLLFTLGWNNWAFGIITVLFLLVSVVLVLTVLIQKPQGGGLSGAFGGAGAGSGQTAFGAKTGDALTVFTIIVFAVYIVFAVTLNYATKGLISGVTAPTTDGAGPADGTAPATDGTTPPAEGTTPTGTGEPAPGTTPPTTPPTTPTTAPATAPATTPPATPPTTPPATDPAAPKR